MNLVVNPTDGSIVAKTDKGKIKTIFFINKGASLVFAYRTINSKEVIQISIFYNYKEKNIVVDGIELESKVEVSVEKDELMESYAFLGNDEMEQYSELCKPFKRRVMV